MKPNHTCDNDLHDFDPREDCMANQPYPTTCKKCGLTIHNSEEMCIDIRRSHEARDVARVADRFTENGLAQQQYSRDGLPPIQNTETDITIRLFYIEIIAVLIGLIVGCFIAHSLLTSAGR